MVEEGLCINEADFMKMRPKQQMCVLFQNQQVTISLIKGYKFQQNINTFLISAALGGVGVLFSLRLFL